MGRHRHRLERRRGDARRLLGANPRLSREGYHYTQPMHFAVRGGHLEAVEALLRAGADPEWNGYYEGSLIEMALERGHTQIAQLLDEARQRLGRVAPGEELSIHIAAQSDDVNAVRRILDADPSLLERGDRDGGSPLHRAVRGSARRVVELLLDRGANIHAYHSTSRGGGGGWWATGVQAIDLAIWGSNLLAWAKGDLKIARLLVSRGAEHDLTVAAALGDLDRVKAILHENLGAIRDVRGNGRRPLSAAVEFRHETIVRVLLDAGADPTWPEFGADRGASLRIAVSKPDNRAMVELLLAHGADPNGQIDSGGTAVWGAPPELRPLLIAHGAKIDSYEAVWLDQDDEVVRRAAEDPEAFDGFVFTGVVTRGTLLHLVCGSADKPRVAIEKATVLLDAGAALDARDEEYRSTPLAWAARAGNLEMVKFLLSRGAPTNLSDDEAWATPLAWAERRNHSEIVSVLTQHDAGR